MTSIHMHSLTHTVSHTHVLTELERWEGAVTRRSHKGQQGGKRKESQNVKDSTEGAYFPKGRRITDCKWSWSIGVMLDPRPGWWNVKNQDNLERTRFQLRLASLEDSEDTEGIIHKDPRQPSGKSWHGSRGGVGSPRKDPQSSRVHEYAKETDYRRGWNRGDPWRRQNDRQDGTRQLPGSIINIIVFI